MDEWLVIDLVIEAAIQMKIKVSLAHKNQSYVQLCYLSYY